MSDYTPSEWEVDANAIWQTWHSLLVSFARGNLSYESLSQRVLDVYRSEEALTELASVPFSHWSLQTFSFCIRAELTQEESDRYEYAADLADSIADHFIDGIQRHTGTAGFGLEHLNVPLLARGYQYQSELYETLSLAHKVLNRENRVSIQDVALLDIGFQVDLSFCVISVLHRDLVMALLPSSYRENSPPSQCPSIKVDSDYHLTDGQLVSLDKIVQRITGHREFQVSVVDGGNARPEVVFSDPGVTIQVEL